MLSSANTEEFLIPVVHPHQGINLARGDESCGTRMMLTRSERFYLWKIANIQMISRLTIHDSWFFCESFLGLTTTHHCITILQGGRTAPLGAVPGGDMA